MQQLDVNLAKAELDTITKKCDKSEQNISDVTKKLLIYKLEYEQLQKKFEEFNKEIIAIEGKYRDSLVEESSLTMKLMMAKAGTSKWDAKVNKFQQVKASFDSVDDTPTSDESLDEEMETDVLKSIHAQKDAINEFFKSNKK